MTQIIQEATHENVSTQSNAGIYTARKSAEFLIKEIDANSSRYYLIPPFISAIASGMEGLVNTAYIDHFHKHFGKSYAKYIKPYLFMRIYDRLSQLPIILSSSKYVINEKNLGVKAIFELFELRNRILHIKHLYHYADIYEDWNGDIVDIQYHDPIHPDPYRVLSKSMPNIEHLKEYMKLFNKFTSKFGNIAYTINRKNFNPDGWFVTTENT